MKRRITIKSSTLNSAIQESCISSNKIGNVTLNHYHLNSLGIKAVLTDIVLPDVLMRYSTISLPFDLGVHIEFEHELIQMHFGLSGFENFQGLGQSELCVLEGQHNMVYVPEKEQGTLVHFRNAGYTSFEINFKPDFLNKLFNSSLISLKNFNDQISLGKLTLLGSNMPITFEMKQAIMNIINCKKQGELKQVYLEAKVKELFALQLTQFTQSAKLKKNVRLHQNDIDKLTSIKQNMDATYELNHSLNDLSIHYGLNTDKLKKGFKQLFGTTVFGYLRQIKMERAMKLLHESNQSIAEISFISGYKNPQHFAKVFKEYYDVQPGKINFDSHIDTSKEIIHPN